MNFRVWKKKWHKLIVQNWPRNAKFLNNLNEKKVIKEFVNLVLSCNKHLRNFEIYANFMPVALHLFIKIQMFWWFFRTLGTLITLRSIAKSHSWKYNYLHYTYYFWQPSNMTTRHRIWSFGACVIKMVVWL